jgi:hypothetical protein
MGWRALWGRSRGRTERRNLSQDVRRNGSSKAAFSVGCFLCRKEVIQPHLPVRLPCYDFTPLTRHTFGAAPPCGLGKRLRVPPTRVV